MVDLLFDEVRGAQLGDVRLNERLVRIVERFGESPNLSIPAATRSRAEMEAAYRFFSNENVSPEKILARDVPVLSRSRLSGSVLRSGSDAE